MAEELVKLRNKKTGEVITLRRKQPEEVKKQIPENFWKALGAEITPGMKEAYPMPSAIAQTAQDVSAIPAAYINQLGFNLPRAALENMGIQYPQTGESLGAKAGYYGAGIAGAIQSPLSRAGLAVAKAPVGASMATRLLRGAYGGAITGAAYTPSGGFVETLPQRAIGAGIGGLVGVTGSVVPPLVKSYRKLQANARLTPTQRISYLEKTAGRKYGKPIEEAQRFKTRLGWQEADTRLNMKQSINDLNIELGNNLKNLDNEIQKSAEVGSLRFQEKLPSFFKSNSEKYGKKLDEITDLISNDYKRMVTYNDVNMILNKTIQDADEALVTMGKPRALLDALYKKYELNFMVDPKSIIKANQPVDLKQLIKEIRIVRSAISGGVKRGTGKFTEEDLIVSMLNKNWGEFVANEIPEFAELQKNYSPVINAMKESARIFKPYKGEYFTKGGTEFLKKVASAEMDPTLLEAGEKRFLTALESGNKFAPGIGDISKTTKELGTKKVNYIIAQELKKRRLEKELADKLASFENKGRETDLRIWQNQDVLKSRLKQLETSDLRGKEHIDKLVANRNRANRIRKAILIGGSLAVGGVSIPYSISRAIMGLPKQD